MDVLVISGGDGAAHVSMLERVRKVELGDYPVVVDRRGMRHVYHSESEVFVQHAGEGRWGPLFSVREPPPPPAA